MLGFEFQKLFLGLKYFVFFDVLSFNGGGEDARQALNSAVMLRSSDVQDG